MSDVLNQLIEMGFTKAKAEKAIECSGNSLEAAMDWIVEHENDNEIDNGAASATNTEPTARSFMCEDCKKSLRNSEEVELHSARTGHINFAESADEPRVLTEEERQQQMHRLQELLKEKKLQRENKEKQEALKREIHRRKQGRTMGSAKAKFQEDQSRRSLEEKKREKMEDKAYREKLLADIARERAEKLVLQSQRIREANTHPQTEEVKPPSYVSSAPKPEYDDCRLQVRLPTGNAVKLVFKSTDTLDTVRLHISREWPDSPGGIDPSQIKLTTNFPRREFSEEDMCTALSDLGLCPSAVLFVRSLSQPL